MRIPKEKEFEKHTKGKESSLKRDAKTFEILKWHRRTWSVSD